MSGMEAPTDPKKGSSGNAPQQITKIPRQVKVKDSRQIQTERNGAPSSGKKKPNYREAAKAVGKGNREILGSKYAEVPTNWIHAQKLSAIAMRALPGAIEVEKFVMVSTDPAAVYSL